jgi:single-strand DNA-binding protein
MHRNHVSLIGELGAEPELVRRPDGRLLLKLRVFTTETLFGKDVTEWHRVTVWGAQADSLMRMLRSGSTVAVEGRLQTSAYEKNGEKRYSTEIVASRVIRRMPAGERTGK